MKVAQAYFTCYIIKCNFLLPESIYEYMYSMYVYNYILLFDFPHSLE